MLNFVQKSAIGLDLSDLAFKVVQLKKRGHKLKLASYLKKDIPLGLIEGGEIKKEAELVEILKTGLSGATGEPLKINRVVCNLPEEKVFIRIIQLPQMKKEEIEKVIKWQIEAHIPLSSDEVYLDWQIIESLEDNINHIDVLIAAAPKILVDSYLNVFKKSGLKILAMEPESVAVVRGLIKKDAIDKPTLILDLGASGTNFVIFSSLAIRFTSHITISGQTFNSAIMEKLAVNKTEAEKIKINVGLKKITKIKPNSSKIIEEGRVYLALEPIIDDLARQIQNYIDFYHKQVLHVHGPDGVIGQVLLCGGDSLLNDLPNVLSQKINLPVKLGNPLINIYDTAPKEILGLSYEKSLAYTTAIGLALRNLE